LETQRNEDKFGKARTTMPDMADISTLTHQPVTGIPTWLSRVPW
jgi:hypothetical protein